MWFPNSMDKSILKGLRLKVAPESAILIETVRVYDGGKGQAFDQQTSPIK